MQSDLKFVENSDQMYKENLAMIVNSPLLKKIISRATDSEYLVCMNILGALRYEMNILAFFLETCVLWEVMSLLSRHAISISSFLSKICSIRTLLI